MSEEAIDYMVIKTAISVPDADEPALLKSDEVNHWLDKGWRILGAPILYNGEYLLQAVIR